MRIAGLAAVGMALAGPARAQDGGATGGAIVLVAISAALYFAPTLLAMGRGHRQTVPIGLLNLFLGWTVIGWVVALVWAFIQGQETATASNAALRAALQSVGTTDRRACPHCAEQILAAAKVCRFCGREVDPVQVAASAPADSYTG